METLAQYLDDLGDEAYSVIAVDDDPEGPPGVTHEVHYDDIPAHAFEDLVAASGLQLGALDGVTSVMHTDREVFLVVAPGLTTEDLTRQLDRFWAEAARDQTGVLRRHFGPTLSPAPERPAGATALTIAPLRQPPALTLREAVRLPASRARLVTHATCAGVGTFGGAYLAALHRPSAVVVLALAGSNAYVAARIHRRRR